MITKRNNNGTISSGSGFKHGLSNKPIYDCWIAMKARCLNKKNPVYYLYGGRGIKICKNWLKFENFYKDMGDMPNKKTLDRTNNNGNYCKENCRWITIQEQQKNRRDNNKFVGVYFDEYRNKWRADITNNGKKYFLGRFKKLSDAIAIRVKAENKFGYEI